MKLTDYIISVLLVIGITFSSCDKWLTVEPSDSRTIQYFYKNPKEMEQALMGVYNGLLPISNYYLLLSEVRSDNVWTGMPEEQEQNYMAFNAFRKQISQISTLNSAWTDYYEIIARANMFLSKTDGVTFSSEAIKNQFIGEAKFLRALAYFDLVRFFGRVPVVTVTQTVEEAMTTPQSETAAVYADIIIPDLQYAIGHMNDVAYDYKGKEAGKDSGRATRAAAQLLKEVIDAANFSTYWAKTADEWKRIWISDNDNKYHIFEIQYIMQSDYGNPMIFNALPRVDKSLCHLKMSGNRIYSSKSLQRLYQQEKTDIRTLHTIRNGETYFEKFFENIVKRDTLGYSNIDGQLIDRTYFPINFPVIRLEDVMLMYADIVGPTPMGIEMVNKIRTRAGLKELTDAQKTSAVFSQCVDEERRRELAGEGVRWHDIVRSGNFITIMRDCYKQEGVEGVTAATNIIEGMYLYPIPDKQMQVREGLYQQNEAYK